MKNTLLFPLCILMITTLTISCSKMHYLKNDLGLSKSEIAMLKKDPDIIDSIFSTSKLLANDRIKYRLDSFLVGNYDKNKLLTALAFETKLGPNFEFRNSISTNSPRFNDLDSLKMYADNQWKKLDSLLQEAQIRDSLHHQKTSNKPAGYWEVDSSYLKNK